MPTGLSWGSDASWSSAFLDSSTLCLADCQRLLGLVAQAVWETDANGQVLVDSPSWRAYTGQSLEAWLGEGWVGAIHPEDQAYALAQWQEAVQRRHSVNAEFRLRSPDGGWRWTNVKAMPVLDQDGSIQKWLGINIDISDKKQAQAALAHNQQRYARELETALHERTAQLQANQQLLQATLDASQDLIQVFEAVRDEQGTIIDFTWRLNNHAAEQYYGDVIGQRLLKANPGVVETGIFATFKQVVETGVPDQSERHYVHEQFAGWFYQSVVKLGDGVATTTADITPRKQAEERLRESEQQFRRLADALPQAIWVTDAEGNVTFLNQWWTDYSGIPFAPTTAWQIAVDILHPEDGPKVATAFRKAMQQGTGFEIEERNRSATGEYRWFLNRAVPYRDPNTGQITQWVGSGVDIHDRKLAEQALQESAAQFRSLIEEAPVATALYKGPELWIEIANEPMMRFFGRGPTILGKPIRQVLTGEQAGDEAAIALLEEVFTSGQAYHLRGAPAQLTIDGRRGTFYFDFSLKPLRNAAGQVYAIIQMAVEVTEQVNASQALQESEARYRQLSVDLEQQVLARTAQWQTLVEDLRRSNENLQQFASIASHDLQEPLRKVQQFGDLLKNQYGGHLGEGVSYLERMQSAASRMSILIKDLLAFSRISTRQEASTPVSLSEVVVGVLSDLELQIEETGARVTVEPLPTVVGDGSQLGQLFANLLGNALKFRRPNTQPQIRVSSQRLLAGELPPTVRPSRMAPAYYQLDVSDNGIGFEPKYVDRIFQIFQRLHGKGEFAGTGIGLAICEKVVTNHGGAITARSQPGAGTTFSVYLPSLE